jgi:hypothetical protein
MGIGLGTVVPQTLRHAITLAPQASQKGRAARIPPIADANLVRVVCGANEDRLPLAGKTIGKVKRSLREVFNISYFADALVNGRVAALDDKLAAGDNLEFDIQFGFKGGEGQPPREVQLAEALIAADTELQDIGRRVKAERLSSENSVDRTLLLVADYFLGRYGKPDEEAQSVLRAVAHQLIGLATSLIRVNETGQPFASVKAVAFDATSGIFFVNGKRKIGLTPAQADVVQALYEAGEAGLNKDELEANSGHSDARRILSRLVEKDADWAAVIHLAGAAHGGYRLG